MLPEGLIPRFIVRTHALSGPPRWRTGVMLEFDGNRRDGEGRPARHPPGGNGERERPAGAAAEPAGADPLGVRADPPVDITKLQGRRR